MKSSVKADRFTTACVAMAIVAVTCGIAMSGQTRSDNTAVNKADWSGAQPTADEQPNHKSDLEVTRQIRRAIVADKSLSTYAHNVKIVTQHRKVTLRGPVRSASEKEIVEAKAAEVAGASNIVNRVSVVPANARPRK
ncbi:MAG: BON domain-containing protein [Acidobacteriota bacterium]